MTTEYETTPDVIYLIPGDVGSNWDYVWSEDPAPTADHDPSEAVRYVKSEAAQLPGKCPKHPTYKVLRKPTANCDKCLSLWVNRKNKEFK